MWKGNNTYKRYITKNNVSFFYKTLVFFLKKYIIMYKKWDDILEEIIKELIKFDENAKNKINEINQKKDNIEEEINNQLKAEKEKIDNQYVFKRKSLKEQYDKIYEENCERINGETEKQIEYLRQKYKTDGSALVDQIVNSIINV